MFNGTPDAIVLQISQVLKTNLSPDSIGVLGGLYYYALPKAICHFILNYL